MICGPHIWPAVCGILLHQLLVSGGDIDQRIGIVGSLVFVGLPIGKHLHAMTPAKVEFASGVSVQGFDIIWKRLQHVYSTAVG